MDIFTFGLGASWVYCLGEVADQHGRDPWRGFKRYEGFNKGRVEGRVAEVVKVGEWKGERVVRDVRPKREEEEEEQEGKSISGIILQQVWDVWEQKDKGGERERDREVGEKGKE